MNVRKSSLVDRPLEKRIEKLKSDLPNLTLTKRIRTGAEKEIKKFYRECIKRGSEGIIAKKLDSKYHPGERGKKWLKLKETKETLDLVITKAQYDTERDING